jgi:hypothetical protein
MRLSHLQQICSEAGKWTSLSKPTHKTSNNNTSFPKKIKLQWSLHLLKREAPCRATSYTGYYWSEHLFIVHIRCLPGKGYLCTVNKCDRKLTSFTPGPCMRTFSVKTGDTYSRIPNYHQQLNGTHTPPNPWTDRNVSSCLGHPNEFWVEMHLVILTSAIKCWQT